MSHRITLRTPVAIVAVALLSLGATSACSSDSSDSASTCKDLQQLSSEVQNLTNLDFIAEGTSGIKSQLDQIESTWKQAKQSGSEQFGDELDKLEQSITALTDTIKGASGSGSITSIISQIRTDAANVSTAWDSLSKAVKGELSDCDLSVTT